MSNIPPHVIENYEAIQAETGASWDDMAAQFKRDGYEDLAEWAASRRSEAKPTKPVKRSARSATQVEG